MLDQFILNKSASLLQKVALNPAKHEHIKRSNEVVVGVPRRTTFFIVNQCVLIEEINFFNQLQLTLLVLILMQLREMVLFLVTLLPFLRRIIEDLLRLQADYWQHGDALK